MAKSGINCPNQLLNFIDVFWLTKKPTVHDLSIFSWGIILDLDCQLLIDLTSVLSAERYINFRFLLRTSLKLDWNFLRDDSANCTVGLITFSCSFKFKRGRREQLLLYEKNPCTLIATSCVMDYRNSEHSTKISNDNESDFFLFKRIEWCRRLRAFFQRFFCCTVIYGF